VNSSYLTFVPGTQVTLRETVLLLLTVIASGDLKMNYLAKCQWYLVSGTADSFGH